MPASRQSCAAMMIAPTFLPNGSVMDLARPAASDIDFAHMAAALAKIARFNGINDGATYSVAQHSVMGADALDRETGDKVLAGYFLLHDGHEYCFGDWPKPSVNAVIFHAQKLAGADDSTAGLRRFIGEAIRTAIAAEKNVLDLAIWGAANLPPIHNMPVYARQVKDMDERMLRAEGLALFGPRAAPHLPAADRPVPRLTGGFDKPWPAEKGREAFIDRLERYLNIVVRN